MFVRTMFCWLLIAVVCLSGCNQSDSEKNSVEVKPTPLSAATSISSLKSMPEVTNDEMITPEPVTDTTEDIVPSESVTPATRDRLEAVAQLKQKYAGMAFFVGDISERSYDDGSAIAVTFSVPIDKSKSFSTHFTVETVSGTVPGSWVLSESGKTAYFENVQPNTHYTVRVNWNITAITGDTMGSSVTRKVSIRPTQPSVSFASAGRFLPLDLHSGLPVTTLNVPEVNIDFHRVPCDQIPNLMAHMGNQSELYQYSLNKVVIPADYVYSGRFELTHEQHKRRTVNIPISNIQQISQPGVYLAVMSIPGEYQSNFKVTYFMVTDIGLHARKYKNQLHLFTNSLKTSQPLAGVHLSLIDDRGIERAHARTNSNGESDIVGFKNTMRYLIASFQDSYSVLDLRGPALDLSDFQTAQRVYHAQEVFVYSERDLYRPGDTINFNALLRNYDGELGKLFPLQARLLGGDGKLVKSFTWHPDDKGYFHQVYPISDSAKTGNWVLELRGLGKHVEKYTFKVEAFIPERLKLTFNPEKKSENFLTQNNPSVAIKGEYLYGAPAVGNQLDANVTVSVDRHPYDAFKTYSFGDETETHWNTRFDLERKTLDDKGETLLNIPSHWHQASSPLSLKIFASLYESGGRPISRYHKLSVVPKKALVGVLPSFKERVEANSDAVFEIIKTDGDKMLVDNSELQIALIRLDRQYFWQYNNQRGWHYEFTDSEYPVFTSQETLNQREIKLKMPVEYGHYRLEITDTSSALKTTYQFQAGEDWYWWWRDANEGSNLVRPDKVTLALDKASYASGDRAQLTILPPADGEAIVKVESDKELWSQRLAVSQKGTTLSIPIDKSWLRHDIYISVMHIQPAINKEKVTPNRAMGLLHLPLNRDNRKIALDILTPEKWLPNQAVNFDIALHDTAASAHKNVWVTVAAVDMGILNITDYQTPEPADFFFGQRRYQVDAIDMYQQIIELNTHKLAKLRFGGDAGELSRGGKKAQSDVQIVSLFSGPVPFTNGKANITFDMPDFNGRIKIMAVAFNGNAFGSAESEVTVAAPLVTQLSMPRFVAWGDESTLALDVNNLSGEPQNLEVTLSADGVVDMPSTTQTLALADKTKQTLIFPFKVLAKDHQSVINLNVDGIADYPINRQWKLNARAPYPGITQRKQARLRRNDMLSVSVEELSGFVPGSVELTVSASNKVDLQEREQLRGLLRYPYGCLEQSTSSTYPWIYADSDYLAKLNVVNATGKTQLQNFANGLERIAKKQKTNGGFGLWSSDSDYEEHWLTSYVGDFLTDAKEQGFDVENAFYNKVVKRLKEYLKSNYSYSMRWSEDPDHYKFAYRAYAGYVLSRMQQANLGHLRSLAQHRDDAASRLSLIHLALALKNQGDNHLAQSVFDEAMNKPVRNPGYLADYGSLVRDQALIIRTLLKNDYHSDDVFAMTLDLASALKDRRYLSTQERNALFMASLELNKSSGENWQATLAYAGAKQQIDQSANFLQVIRGRDVAQGLSLVSKNKKDLFASIAYVGHKLTAPAAVDDLGLNIVRSYYNRHGEEITPSEFSVGDLVLVRLAVASEKRRPDVMVIDLLPAGLELENQNLTTAANLDDWMVEDKKVMAWRDSTKLVHQEFRDDRFVAAMELSWRGRAEIFYLARAVTPGTYKVPVPFVEDMYDPEVYGIGESIDQIVVK